MGFLWSRSIVQFKMVNVMVAFRMWGSLWTNEKVKVNNAAVVSILNNRRTKDPFLSACDSPYG